MRPLAGWSEFDHPEGTKAPCADPDVTSAGKLEVWQDDLQGIYRFPEF
jgi:hypothetical protein